jgi:hypothetical protein
VGARAARQSLPCLRWDKKQRTLGIKVAVQTPVGPRFLETDPWQSRSNDEGGQLAKNAELRHVVGKVWKLSHAMTSNLIRVSARDPMVTDAFADFDSTKAKAWH